MIDSYENEIWKDVYFIENGIEWDFRGLYQISNFGGVKSFHNGKERILKARKNTGGYELIRLCKNGKRKFFLIHRLVAHMFLVNDNPIEKIEVNHKDENKANNHVENLEWCTSKYNANYGTRNEKQSEAKKGKYKGAKNPKARRIISVDPLTKRIVFTYQYVKQATDFYSIGKCTLSYYLKGKAKSGHEYNGFLWYYADEWESLKEE